MISIIFRINIVIIIFVIRIIIIFGIIIGMISIFFVVIEFGILVFTCFDNRINCFRYGIRVVFRTGPNNRTEMIFFRNMIE